MVIIFLKLFSKDEIPQYISIKFFSETHVLISLSSANFYSFIYNKMSHNRIFFKYDELVVKKGILFRFKSMIYTAIHSMELTMVLCKKKISKVTDDIVAILMKTFITQRKF